MNRDEEIEAALRRRPSDERVYGESLTDLVAANGMTRVRPATRPRSRTGARPALLAVIVVLAVGAGAVEIGLLNRSTSQRDLGGNTLELTGRVACFGQGPGWAPNTDSTSAESCPVMVVPPDGYGAATWTLDPSVPYSGGATEIHILVDEWGCHGFETAAGRIVQNVQYRDDAVIVTLAVRRLGGMQTCPGTPPTPYVLHLPQSVGSRELQDGGLWPAKTIATGGRVVTTPTPTPYPANWHQPIECTGEADGPGSFKSASMTANFDVYCAALPAGWMRASMSDFQQVVTSVTVTYRGPEGQSSSWPKATSAPKVPPPAPRADLTWAPLCSARGKASLSRGRREPSSPCTWLRANPRRGRRPGVA